MLRKSHDRCRPFWPSTPGSDPATANSAHKPRSSPETSSRAHPALANTIAAQLSTKRWRKSTSSRNPNPRRNLARPPRFAPATTHDASRKFCRRSGFGHRCRCTIKPEGNSTLRQLPDRSREQQSPAPCQLPVPTGGSADGGQVHRRPAAQSSAAQILTPVWNLPVPPSKVAQPAKPFVRPSAPLFTSANGYYVIRPSGN